MSSFLCHEQSSIMNEYTFHHDQGVKVPVLPDTRDPHSQSSDVKTLVYHMCPDVRAIKAKSSGGDSVNERGYWCTLETAIAETSIRNTKGLEACRLTKQLALLQFRRSFVYIDKIESSLVSDHAK